MRGRGEHVDAGGVTDDPSHDPPMIDAGPWFRIASATLIGTAAGLWLPIGAWGWLVLALMAFGAVGMIAHLFDSDPQSPRRGLSWLIVWAVVVAGWASVQTTRQSPDNLSRWLSEEGALTRVRGVIASEPRVRGADAGVLGRFTYESPKTLMVVQVEELAVGSQAGKDPDNPNGWTAVSGQLLVKVDGLLTGLAVGEPLELLGWAARVQGLANPGEFDYANWLAKQGIAGRLSINQVTHVQRRPDTSSSWWAWVSQARSAMIEQARWSLSLDMVDEDAPCDDNTVLALLEALLLGHRGPALEELREGFRRTGLQHLLSISGAHLAILMGLAWGLTRALTARPGWSAGAVPIIGGLYVLLVPAEVPVLRAGLMALLFFGPMMLGRAAGALRAWSIALVLMLLWKPGDLADAGFQLSFGTVWAMARFTRPVARSIWPNPVVRVTQSSLWERTLRFVWEATVASTVAFVFSMPLVAYHFGVISPLAIVLSVATLPVVMAVLGLGFVKMVVGVALPSVSVLLSGPMRWVTGMMISLVEEAGRWPASAIELGRPTGAAWCVAALAVGVALLMGWYRRRPVALSASIAVVMLWLGGSQRWWGAFLLDGPPPVMSVTTLAVGDGSCFVIQSGGQTLVFDCGSQGYPEIGRRSVVPALRYMGVRRIDLLVLSHADLDHFSGVPELVEAISVDRIIASPELLAEARSGKSPTTSYLVQWLDEHGLRVEPVTIGWKHTLGNAQIEALWPPPPEAGWDAPRSNDHSLVLRFEAGGRRILMNGDVQDLAIAEMFDRDTDLRADVADLPHHGSFGDQSLRWIDAVRPTIVLQSSGPARLRNDKWAQPLADHPHITRAITDTLGMSTVRIEPDGAMSLEWFGRGGDGGVLATDGHR